MLGNSALGSFLPVAMALVGVVTILRARARRRKGQTDTDDEFERRQRAAAEMERRMASYLAQRDSGGEPVAAEWKRQENGR